jgi:hypothetical protein
MSDYAEHRSYSHDHLAPEGPDAPPCSFCRGAGYLYGRVRCPECDGTGQAS